MGASSHDVPRGRARSGDERRRTHITIAAPRQTAWRADRAPARSRNGAPTAAYVASVGAAGLAAAAAVAGLAWDGLYRDAGFLIPAMRAQDLVVLTLVLPTLAWSMSRARKGSLRGRILWGGSLGFLVYAYATWAFQVSFNELFLVYVGVLSLATFSLASLLASIDTQRVRTSFSPQAPVRTVAWFLFVFMSLYAAVELAQIIGFVATGDLPQSLIDWQKPTSVIMVLDLGFLFPIGFLAGVWLLRHRPWGYVVAPMILVKSAFTGLSVGPATSVFGRLEGRGYPIFDALFFAALATAALVLWRFLRTCFARGELDDRMLTAAR